MRWLQRLDCVGLAPLLLGCTACLLLPVTSLLGARWCKIVRVASSAVHRASAVYCKTLFTSSIDTVQGGEEDGEEASESGL